MINDNIEIAGSVEVAEGIKNRVRTVGVRGLNAEEASRLGLFARMGNLLCVTHATIMAAYHIFGEFDYLIDKLHARKNEINHEMNLFDKAIVRFIKFWTNYYAQGKIQEEVNTETERLFHKIMDWAQIPEEWQLGDEQRTHTHQDVCIQVELPNDRVFTFHKTELNNEYVNEPEETWGVLCYNPSTNTQKSVNTNMDKASAMMVAKRLSEENPENIYSTAIIRDVVEKKTEVIPFKAFRNNQTVGKLTI